jgi:hypothetical protein
MAAAWKRVIPPGPAVPRIAAVTEGVNLLSGATITSGAVKLAIEEVRDPALLRVTVNGEAAGGIEWFCTEPVARMYEFNFNVPRGARGRVELRVALGARAFPPMWIEVA